jgi:hypothetical protein
LLSLLLLYMTYQANSTPGNLNDVLGLMLFTGTFILTLISLLTDSPKTWWKNKANKHKTE